MAKVRTRAAWASELLKAAKILKPRGEGPFPLVFLLHGCGGVRPFLDVYAQAALKAGYAVIIPDSFKPRGLGRLTGSALVCTGAILQGAERSADLYALYDWARREPWVDPDRIAAAGWSHGSWAIMDALALGEHAEKFSRLSDLPAEPLDGLKAAILVYPYAGYPAITTNRGWGRTRPRVFALIGGKDQVVGHRLPGRAIDRLERDGLHVERLVFPDATHAFEDEKASDPRSRYRPDLRDQAVDWFQAALKSSFA